MTDSPETAAYAVLFYLGYEGGRPPGSFVKALVEAAFQADSSNLAALGNAFPFIASAVRMAKNDRDGVRNLQIIAQVPTERQQKP